MLVNEISGWWFGTCFFPIQLRIIIPFDELHHFSEGVGWNHQPDQKKGGAPQTKQIKNESQCEQNRDEKTTSSFNRCVWTIRVRKKQCPCPSFPVPIEFVAPFPQWLLWPKPMNSIQVTCHRPFYPKPIEVYQFSHLRNIQKILEKTVEMMEKTVGFWWFLYIFDDQNPRGIHGIFVGHLHEESPRIILFPWHRQPGVWLVVNYPQYTYKYIYIHLWNIIVPGNETHTIQYHHSTAHIYRRCSHYH